ncbi:hypothetical protein [Penaeicola halotolerans]|uniref:hypothetical protein n=1 Tax=Penaeicola halotolerans TaxID=2793196 RepID=UPI001CF893F7|nr:hypothetical protein [Penaeicola halotolerans]
MKNSTYRFRSILVSLVLIHFVSGLNPAFSQSKKTFSGPYQWKDGREGTATFQYIEAKNGDRILDGDFIFKSKKADSLDQNIFNKFEVRGTYKNGKKTGDWSYISEEHTVKVNDVIDFKVDVDLQSIVRSLKAAYKEEVPSGDWSYDAKVYQQGELEPKFAAEKLSFKNGDVIGRISIVRFDGVNNYSIEGYTNSAGFMDSTWRLSYMEDSILYQENRLYQDGILLELSKTNLKDSTTQRVDYVESKRKLKLIADKKNDGFIISDREFNLRFNDGYRRRDDEFQFQLSGNAFIERILQQLLQFDESYFSENGTFKNFPIKTKRFEYPVAADDKKIGEEAGKIYKSLSDKVDKYVNYNALNINRQRSDSLAFAAAFFKTMDQKLDAFDNIIDIITTDRIKYVDQSIYTRNGLDYLAAYDTIRYRFQGEDREKVLEFRQVIESETELLNAINSYLKEENKVVDQVIKQVSLELEKIEKDESLQKLETELLNKKETLDTLYLEFEYEDVETERLVKDMHQRFLEDYYDSLNASYAQAEKYEDRFNRLELMMEFLEEMEELHAPFLVIYKNQADLDTYYMEESFDPFIYQTVEKRTKPRLYRAGERLFSEYMNQLRTQGDYTLISEQLNKIYKLHKRMKELRDEDTRKLERRISRTEDIAQYERLLDL